MSKITHVFLLTSAILITACASANQKPYQRVHITTPGVENAECILSTGDSKATAVTPQTVTIRRHDAPLKVRCKSPDNRVARAVYHTQKEGSQIPKGYYAGMYYDYAEQAADHYPRKIALNFNEASRDDASKTLRQHAHEGKREKALSVPVPAVDSGKINKKTISAQDTVAQPDTKSTDKNKDGAEFTSDNATRNTISATDADNRDPVIVMQPEQEDQQNARSISHGDDRGEAIARERENETAVTDRPMSDMDVQEAKGDDTFEDAAKAPSQQKVNPALPLTIQSRQSQSGTSADPEAEATGRQYRTQQPGSFEAQARQQMQDGDSGYGSVDSSDSEESGATGMSSPTKLY